VPFDFYNDPSDHSHYWDNALDALIGVENKGRSRDLLPFQADDLALPRPKAQSGELAGESGRCIKAADRL
jgi:hypothetical protein